MNVKRLWHTFRLYTILQSHKRTEYMKKQQIFRQMGDDVTLMLKKIPLYPELIKFHNNIVVGANVTFVTHDAAHWILNNQARKEGLPGKPVQEQVGCIEIRDNVFVGAGSVLMSGVCIGPNAIIGAGSVVTKDVPPNSVVAGVPARVIGTYDAYAQKRRDADRYPEDWMPVGQHIPAELVENCWEKFDKQHSC